MRRLSRLATIVASGAHDGALRRRVLYFVGRAKPHGTPTKRHRLRALSSGGRLLHNAPISSRLEFAIHPPPRAKRRQSRVSPRSLIPFALKPLMDSRLGSGRRPPHPPADSDPRAPPTLQNPTLLGSNFSGFLGPCGAKSWGGGGAPPTTLILLRNQRARDRRATRRRVRGCAPPSDRPRPFERGIRET